MARTSGSPRDKAAADKVAAAKAGIAARARAKGKTPTKAAVNATYNRNHPKNVQKQLARTGAAPGVVNVSQLAKQPPRPAPAGGFKTSPNYGPGTGTSPGRGGVRPVIMPVDPGRVGIGGRGGGGSVPAGGFHTPGPTPGQPDSGLRAAASHASFQLLADQATTAPKRPGYAKR